MTRIRGSLEISAPVEEVFDFVADQRNEVRYNPKMTESTKTTPGPIGLGTRFRASVLRRGKPLEVLIQCTGFDRPYRFATRSVTAGAIATGEVRCEPIPDGTRFSWDWELSVLGPARFAGPMVALMGRREERVIWTGLKRLFEENPATP
jgi:hypothetical protein